MTAGAPWSVKGIDPKTREVAKDLARRSGMTLGEWLNTVIVSGDDENDPPHTARPEPEGREPTRFARPSNPSGSELARVASALERLTARIEAAEHRSSLAISGVDQSVQGVLARLAGSEDLQAATVGRVEALERDGTAVAARLDAALTAMRNDQELAAERLRRIEEEGSGPRSADALKSIETALGKIAGQLNDNEHRTRAVLGEIGREFDDMSRRLDRLDARPDPEVLAEKLVDQLSSRLSKAEAQTSTAIKALETSFADLDQRLRAAEDRPVDDGAARFEQLAAELSARVEAFRAELAQKLDAAACDGRLDEMERVVRDLTGQVEAAERRSHRAVEKMGHEVLRIAGVINSRMQQVENRTADAVEQVGGEVARVAEAMEARLRASDSAHAEALERLGAEIGRISERLAERIAASERRSAQAIDDVGEQVGRVAEKINARYDQAANDLAERIKQSEERTARFLEEARERIDQRLTETSTRIAEQVSPVQQGFVGFQARLEQLEAHASYMPPFGNRTAAASAEPSDIFADRGPARPAPKPAAMDPAAVPFPSSAPPPAATTVLHTFPGEEPFDGFASEEPADADGTDPFPSERPSGVAPDSPPRPTGADFAGADPEADLFEPAPTPTPAPPEAPLSTRDVLERARAAARASAVAAPAPPAARPSIFARLKLSGRKDKRGTRRRDSTLRTALLASATAAALSVFGAGYVIFAQEGPKPEAAAAEGAARSTADATGGGTLTPQLASLTADPPETAVVAPLGDGAGSAAYTYAEAAAALEAGRAAEGLADLRRAANLGHTPAQLHLANLYATGGDGVARDPSEARRWTERAARGGDRRAMHNLGLLYFEGDGGPKNVTLAAQWFRRAAEAGLIDSQYNLGLIHEKGYGVTRNAAEAYKWYIVAARGGDTEARAAAERLERTLSDEARAAAERSALAFRAPGGVQVASALSTDAGGDVAAAQRALSGLGYYQGPTDGRTSPALQAAVAAWQRDTGRPADGVIDADVISGLSAG